MILLVGILGVAALAGALLILRAPAPADTTPPRVDFTVPDSSETGVDLANDSLVVAFTEDMERSALAPGAVSLSFSKCTSCGIDYSPDWVGPRKLRIALLTPLPSGHVVEVKLYSSDFKDQAGNRMQSTYSWQFTTRDVKIEVQNSHARAVGGDYIVTGELLNREAGVIAPYLWKNGTGGAAPAVVVLRASYLDANGSELSNDFCVTPRLVGVKSGGTLPFRCTAYDPDAKIKSHTLKPDTWYSLPLLWSVSPYEFALGDIVPAKGGGKYSVNLTLRNGGAKSFDKDTVVVALTAYLGDGKVVGFAAATNAATLGPGMAEKLTVTVDDPGGVGSYHSLSVSVFHP